MREPGGQIAQGVKFFSVNDLSFQGSPFSDIARNDDQSKCFFALERRRFDRAYGVLKSAAFNSICASVGDFGGISNMGASVCGFGASAPSKARVAGHR